MTPRFRSSIKVTLACVGLLTVAIGWPMISRAKDRRAVFKNTLPSVVMVMAADIIDDEVVPMASGSGTIIDADGSVLTNYHVISDTGESRLYDLFIVGRFRSAEREPEMICAGRPSHSKLKPKLDLALIKCDLDLEGEPWKPQAWPTLPIGRSEEIVPGEEVWVLGYPNVGEGTIHVTSGLVSGWTSEEGGANSRAFMKTDAAISHGNSGGAAIDENGNLVGVPTAFREVSEVKEDRVRNVGKVGLIRPIEHTRDLIAVARKGWKPEAGKNSVARASGIDVSEKNSAGVTLRSRVVDATNRSPVEGALVVVLKPGTPVKKLNGGNMGELAITWGQTNAGGSFELKKPLTRNQVYPLVVIAAGYQPLASDDALRIDDTTPDLYDPFGELRIRRR